MKYLAAIDYSDYDYHEIRYLTFEGSEEELAIFSEKFRQAGEWYKDSMNAIFKQYKKLTAKASYKKPLSENDREKVKSLELESRSIKNIIIDGIWIDMSFIQNRIAEITYYELPEFITLDQFFENQKQRSVEMTEYFKISKYDNIIGKEF